MEFYCSNNAGSGGHIRYATEYYFVTLEFAGVAVAIFFVVRLTDCSTFIHCCNQVYGVRGDPSICCSVLFT